MDEMKFFRIRRFSDMQTIGDAYRAGATVDLVLDQAEPDLYRRAIDFSSGMVYLAQGHMQRIADAHFRLTPGPPRPI